VLSNLKVSTRFYMLVALMSLTSVAVGIAGVLGMTALVVGLNIGGLLVSCVVAVAVVRSIVGPLKSMQDAIVSAERDCDFTHRVPVHGRDETGITANAFNGLMQNLRLTFGEMRGNVGELTRAAHTLSATAQAAAAGSNDSSEAASSMAASVEEMTVGVSHIADNARDASTLSADSGREAEAGGCIIHDTTAEIQNIASTINESATIITELGEQSGRISGVVKVIRDVAEQTNLLALNAAIEAARAGEEGRGFAVVADEVRKLAERTASSTAEIAGMVEAIQKSAEQAVAAMQATVGKVETGVGLAKGAERAMRNIHESAARVGTVVADMSAALAEQSSAANAIAEQVERVAQGADQSSNAARGTADSAEELASLAEQMNHALARFKV
jgi:methyl-accepting chemotaxis protein